MSNYQMIGWSSEIGRQYTTKRGPSYGQSLLLTCLTLLSGLAIAAEETWHCEVGQLWVGTAPPQVKLVSDLDSGIGSVSVAGVTYEAAYFVEGFARNWFFGPPTEHYDFSYGFMIGPGGGAEFLNATLLDPNDADSMQKHREAVETYICKIQ